MTISLKQIDNKFCWSFLGATLGLIAIILTIYLALYEKRAAIDIEITSESNVLDIHRTTDRLSISFDGQDIAKNNQNLKIVNYPAASCGASKTRKQRQLLLM